MSNAEREQSRRPRHENERERYALKSPNEFAGFQTRFHSSARAQGRLLTGADPTRQSLRDDQRRPPSRGDFRQKIITMSEF